MNTEKGLVVVNNQQLALQSFLPILSATGSLLGPRRFIAKQFGFCVAKGDNGNLDWSEIKDMNTKEVREKIVSAGLATKEQVSEAITSYNEQKERFYTESTKATALIGADQSLRKEVRMVQGKKGLIGFNVKARFVKSTSSNATRDARIAELEKELAAAKLLLAGGQA